MADTLLGTNAAQLLADLQAKTDAARNPGNFFQQFGGAFSGGAARKQIEAERAAQAERMQERTPGAALLGRDVAGISADADRHRRPPCTRCGG